MADGNDLVAIEDAINAAKADTTRPTLIRVRTVIGYGSPKAGTNKAHGEAMGTEAARETKKNLGWPEDKSFYVPEEARANWDHDQAEGQEAARGVGRAALPSTRRRIRSRRRSSSAWLRASWPRAGRRRFRASRRAGCQEGGDAHRWKCGDERDREGGAGAVWRRGRYDGFDQDDLQWLAQLPCGCGGAEHLLRRARVRHDGDGERDGGARRADSVWVDVLRLLGLLQAGDPAGLR